MHLKGEVCVLYVHGHTSFSVRTEVPLTRKEVLEETSLHSSEAILKYIGRGLGTVTLDISDHENSVHLLPASRERPESTR